MLECSLKTYTSQKFSKEENQSGKQTSQLSLEFNGLFNIFIDLLSINNFQESVQLFGFLSSISNTLAILERGPQGHLLMIQWLGMQLKTGCFIAVYLTA